MLVGVERDRFAVRLQIAPEYLKLDLDTYGVGVAAGALIFLAFWLTSA
jgi:hypothetical protein